jgi:hypothetical protein
MTKLTFRYRIKDATASKHLKRLAWAVNTVWNYCNEVSVLALRRDKCGLSVWCTKIGTSYFSG